jgi:alkyl hydroperoxide reductase subunit AhpC
VIDKDGVVQHIVVNDQDMQAHSIDSLEAVKKLA